MKNALAGVERALFWTLAFAAFAAVAVGLGARAADRLASHYDAERASYAIVRVTYPEGPEGMEAAEAALRAAPHVAEAAPMSAERAAALLAEWSGAAVRPEDMPALSLIELTLAASAPRDVATRIERALTRNGVSAEIIMAPEASSGAGVGARVRTAALWGAGAFALVMALIVSLAARGIAARRREWVIVMADCGATRSQAAGKVADEAALLGLGAGAVGAGLAGAVAIAILLLAIPGAGLDALRAMILPIDLIPLAAAPFITAIAAGAGARAAAGQFHAQAARLG